MKRLRRDLDVDELGTSIAVKAEYNRRDAGRGRRWMPQSDRTSRGSKRRHVRARADAERSGRRRVTQPVDPPVDGSPRRHASPTGWCDGRQRQRPLWLRSTVAERQRARKMNNFQTRGPGREAAGFQAQQQPAVGARLGCATVASARSVRGFGEASRGRICGRRRRPSSGRVRRGAGTACGRRDQGADPAGRRAAGTRATPQRTGPGRTDQRPATSATRTGPGRTDQRPVPSADVPESAGSEACSALHGPRSSSRQGRARPCR